MEYNGRILINKLVLLPEPSRAPFLLRFLQTNRENTISTYLFKDDLPRVKPLEVDVGQDEVEEGRSDDEDGQLPAQPGQQVKGLVLLSERPNVVAEGQVFFPHFER